MKKLVILFFIFPLLMLILCGGCRNPFLMGKEPEDGTSWATEDGKIMFTYHESGMSYGTMEIDGETIALEFTICDGRLDIADFRSEPPKIIERLYYRPENENEFVAEVWRSTYLELEQKIKFYRLDYDPFAAVNSDCK